MPNPIAVVLSHGQKLIEGIKEEVQALPVWPPTGLTIEVWDNEPAIKALESQLGSYGQHPDLWVIVVSSSSGGYPPPIAAQAARAIQIRYPKAKIIFCRTYDALDSVAVKTLVTTLAKEGIAVAATHYLLRDEWEAAAKAIGLTT